MFSDTSFVLGESTFRMPDVAFVHNRKLAHYNPDKMFSFAPDLAIEIVSEHDEAVDLETKIEQFLTAGSQAVCEFTCRLGKFICMNRRAPGYSKRRTRWSFRPSYPDLQ